MTTEQSTDDTTPIWGASQIGRAIGLSPRAAFYLLESGKLPAKKILGRWVSSRHALLKYLLSGVSEARLPAPSYQRQRELKTEARAPVAPPAAMRSISSTRRKRRKKDAAVRRDPLWDDIAKPARRQPGRPRMHR